MLASLRNTTDNFFVKLLLILLVASFALWGVGDIVGGSNDVTVATVGEEPVSGQEYYSALVRLQDNLGEYFTPEFAKELNLFNVTLGGLISEKLIQQEADHMNLVVSDRLLKDVLLKDTQFHNEKGQFDRTIFDHRLRQLRISESDYLNQLRQSVRENLLQRTISPSAIYGDTLPSLLYLTEQETRRVLTFVVEPNNENNLSAPDEVALQSYFTQHKQAYMAPEYRVLHYVLLDKQAIAQNIILSENELQQAYEERKKERITPQKRFVTQLLYDDKALAERAYGLLRSGKTLDFTAKSLPPANEGNLELGYVTAEQLPAGSDQVFALDEGEYTSPIQTEFGWHVFAVQDVVIAHTPSYDALKEQLSIDLKAEEINNSMAQAIEKMEDAVSAGLSINDIASTLNLPLMTTPPIDANGKQTDNTMHLAPEHHQFILDAGFAQEQGTMSSVETTPDGQYYLVKPMQVTPPRERTLEEVRGIVVSDWKQQQRQNMIRQRANDTLDALKQSFTQHDIDSANHLLDEQNISSYAMLPIKRDGVASDDIKKSHGLSEPIPEDFIAQIFTLNQPGQVTDLYTYGRDSVIGGIYIDTTSHEMTNQDTQNASYVAIEKRLEKVQDQEISQYYLGSLKRRFPVARDAEAVERVKEQF